MVLVSGSDFNDDWKVDNSDRLAFVSTLSTFTIGTNDCLPNNNFCGGADIDINGKVEEKDVKDFIAAHLSSCSNVDTNYQDDLQFAIDVGMSVCDVSNNYCIAFDIDGNGILDSSDKDLLIDFETGCLVIPECNDGIDNDDDNLTDIADSDCIDGNDTLEGIPECNDGIDNDGDGLIDGLVETNGSNNESLTIAFTWAESFIGYVNGKITANNLPLSLLRGQAVLRQTGPWSGGTPHTLTLNKVCEIAGYSSVKSHSCWAKGGDGCNFNSPGDNTFSMFNGDDFVTIPASPKHGKSWIGTLVCEGKFSQCIDKMDNDGDGLVDYCDGTNAATCDPGCATADDESEIEHDPSCENLNDDSEGESTIECADEIDNDGDGLIDFQDSDCWTDPLDPNSYDPTDTVEAPKPECSDGQDNDGDGLFDFCDGTNVGTCDPGCGNQDDDVEDENAPECSDGIDNDIDGFIDNKDPDCWTDVTDPSTYDPSDDNETLTLFLDQVYWANIRDDLRPINEASLNSLVKLIAPGFGLSGVNIEYEIYKEGIIPFFDIFDPKVASSDVQGFLTWRAGKKDDGGKEEGDFYFRARFKDGEWVSTKDNSNTNFHILKVRGPEINIPPVANITGPDDKQIYFLNEVLVFTQDSYDVDDEFSYVWDLEERVTRIGDSLSLENYGFNYSYGTTGQKNILLTVIDDRGIEARDQISILVINSSFVLSYIDSPRFGQVFGKEVSFDARSSYSIEETIIGGNREITCLAGNCPNQTEGCPPPETGCHLPVLESPKGYEDLTFTWIFDGNANNPFEAMGDAGVNFIKIFPSIGTHTAELTTSINPSSISTTSFEVYEIVGEEKLDKMINRNDKLSIPGSFIGQNFWIETINFILR